MNKDELLKLDNQLCFAVYACSREITSLYRPYLDQLGITYPQYLALLVLWDVQECSVKELGDRLYLDSGTLTPMLKRMEAADLIKRQRSVDDERKVNVRLTENGKALKEEAYCIPEVLFAKSGVTPTEFQSLLAQFNGLLHKINQVKLQS
ncbi:MarR family winged helix-turn-helix transcriptional regulator [Brevibacillus sp. SYSU BS000544]|uniref:MarR family winged helix-turn-helix transcriptional regulator n=1 Tax=Brevibacillus sp. SYSU BS000544 TaxID=3416443 RepID=UPI003CE4A59D